ncbi:MAG: hypothetical protein VKL39_21740 [Leptolyngbyaceae bacterium]|nr:hypothetical protein [Leptolyngbyaceae bacterium]
MKAFTKYTNLEDTLIALKQQVADSIDFCIVNFSGMRSADELFYILKNHVHYVNDPKNVETIQTAQTLLSKKNVLGSYGAGDCDCFTVLASACFEANNWPYQIRLVGNGKHPTHIYNIVKCPKLGWMPFDLTNPIPGIERKYYKMQTLPVNIIWKN